MLTKNLKCTINGKTVTAMWQHVVDLHYTDEGAANIRVLPKLTENHVLVDKIPKMKVTRAAQIFSQRVSATMRFFALEKCNQLPKEAQDTATILLFFDELFDSVNSSFDKMENGKIYRTVKNSPHHALWVKALKILKLNHSGKECTSPTTKNWKTTVEGFQNLWKCVYTQKIKSFLTRNINHDPL